MRSKIINACLKFIKENKDVNGTKLDEIRYGLESIYILVEKTIIIFFIAFIFHIAKELLLLLLFYNFIRMTSFGLHATKSSICLFSSVLIFLGCAFFSRVLLIPIYGKVAIGSLCILFMYKNAPADTYKRPIVSRKRREIYKLLSTIIAITYSICAVIIANNFISNLLLFSLIIQNFLIAPTVYKFFKLPYDNYKTYISSQKNLNYSN